jgi:hypothetical protein
VNDIGNLWEYVPIFTDDGEMQMIWERVRVIKMTAKRIYTASYRSAQLWGYDKIRPYFDKATLLRDGSAWHRSRPPGGNPACLLVYTDAGRRAIDRR